MQSRQALWFARHDGDRYPAFIGGGSETTHVNTMYGFWPFVSLLLTSWSLEMGLLDPRIPGIQDSPSSLHFQQRRVAGPIGGFRIPDFDGR